MQSENDPTAAEGTPTEGLRTAPTEGAHQAGPPPPGAPRRDETGLPSLPRRFLQVLFSPGELFDALARRPAWLGAFLLGAGLVVVGTVALPEELYVEMMREQAAAGGAEGGPTPETMARLARIFGGVLGAVAWAVMMGLWAGAATVVFALLLGDDARFRQYFAATCHAFLVAALGAVLLVPLKIAQGDLALTLSVGTFFEGLVGEGYLDRVLSGLDLFTLWSVLVLAVAVSRFDRNRSWGSAAAVLLAFWIGVAAIMGIFSFGAAA